MAPKEAVGTRRVFQGEGKACAESKPQTKPGVSCQQSRSNKISLFFNLLSKGIKVAIIEKMKNKAHLCKADLLSKRTSRFGVFILNSKREVHTIFSVLMIECQSGPSIALSILHSLTQLIVTITQLSSHFIDGKTTQRC